jgi:hypothetical protein
MELVLSPGGDVGSATMHQHLLCLLLSRHLLLLLLLLPVGVDGHNRLHICLLLQGVVLVDLQLRWEWLNRHIDWLPGRPLRR